MSTTTEAFVDPVNTAQLMNELNNSPDLQATCIGVLNDMGNIVVQWNQDIDETGSPSELDNALAIISSHVPTPQEVDVAQLPMAHLGDKLAVHSSSMPAIGDKVFYDVFTGSGDDVDNHIIGGGDLCQFAFAPSIPELKIEVHFDPTFGDVYVHGGYVKFQGGDYGDYIQSEIKARGSILQQVANLDLAVDNDGWVTYVSPGGGTHGFGATPNLIPRKFQKDGEWDYDGVNLVPNFSGEGEYRISVNEVEVHRYINKLPCLGDCTSWLEIESSEAAYVPPNYYICVHAFNNSGSSWNASVIINLYRETTRD